MTETDFDEVQRLLAEQNFLIDTARYDAANFGSWHITLALRPPLRVVWDGKDQWLLVQRERSQTSDSSRLWDDLWIGKDPAQQTPADALAALFSRPSHSHYPLQLGPTLLPAPSVPGLDRRIA